MPSPIKSKPNAAKRTAFLGMLTAAALALSYLESLLPVLPFLPPGAKAGFSNIVIMFVLQVWAPLPALCIVLSKAGFALLTRGITAGLMSCCGGLLAFGITHLCTKKNVSLLLTGVLSAIGHNTAQMGAAILITATPMLIHYYPLLLLFAIPAGGVTGFLLAITLPPLRKIADVMISPLTEKR